MQPDYYQTLGIQADANPDAIKHAYWKRAMECHPDRGGSHEQMLLINEAFQILSKSETRARYDAARKGQTNQQTEADRDQARQNAANYPRHWASFQTWLDAISNDFDRARYDAWHSGNVGKSFSGWVFFVIAAAVGIGITLFILGAFNWETNSFFGKVTGRLIIMACIGAALALHKSIRDSLRPPGSQPQQQHAQDQHKTSDAHKGIVISCPQCSQKLRIPMGRPDVRLRCTSCGQTFVHTGGVGA